ncbi:hypothetical protein M441DRAFT_68301 [Trichoderma asperellum CBS 433.97]|uniref:Uncharacterized protein n=1 Tax=Trichoderma asperellum (strain ATCC 204424 / CBS 433.97 / NBRC 101777) TaxID=1042311 RepID=A0A2T3Z8W7_TRIA4|nr:hypothetical protein M441DRAFT_68301 [Trichoderma asperellum CBS 433.97]PTB41254.1 hypothetical protein M441DRAFT_68301 [Trichoderma asperellum CBS 433.97]
MGPGLLASKFERGAGQVASARAVKGIGTGGREGLVQRESSCPQHETAPASIR